MKKLLSLVLAVLLILPTLGNIAYAQSGSLSEIVDAKQALAALHSDKYIENYNNTAGAAQRNTTVAELVSKMQCGEVDKETALNTLEKIGVYELDTEVAETSVSVMSVASDITLNAATVLYDSYCDQWIVSCGGYWNNEAWATETGSGYLGNVGGCDAIGLSIYSTSGTYNTKIVDSYAYYSDGDETSSYVYSPSLSSGTNGSIFEYQDNIHYSNSNRRYIGKHFAVVVNYDSSFENFHGYVRGYYAHTWSTAYISSIAFGTGGTYIVTIQNSAYSFKCQSSSETRF